MIIEQVTDLGTDALKHPKKFKGFMGVSIRNDFFSKERMRDLIRWGSDQFETFNILLMDDPDRVNLQIFKSLDKDLSLTRARALADDSKIAFQKIVNQYLLQNVKIFQFRDFCNSSEYKKALVDVKGIVEENHALKKSLWGVMQASIRGKIAEFATSQGYTPSQIDSMEKVLFTYAVEEFAALIYFTENIAPIEVDPHVELQTKKELYEGLYPKDSVKLGLTPRGHVFVSISQEDSFKEH